MDARLVELWLRLTADAVRGADDAQRALEALGSSPMSAGSLAAWMKPWLPDERSTAAGISETDASEFESLVEGWWHLLGVVPRYQHDALQKRCEELQRRNDALQRRVEQAESTIRRIGGDLSSMGRETDAHAALDTWESLARQTLQAQTEWTRRWLQGVGDAEGDDQA